MIPHFVKTLLILLALSDVASTTAFSFSTKPKVAVIGSTGNVGIETIIYLHKQNIPTKCLLRHELPKSNSDIEPSIDKNATKEQKLAYLSELPTVEWIKGDITDPSSLRTLLKDCSAVVAVHGAPRPSSPFQGLMSTLFPSSDPKVLESLPLDHPYHVNYIGVQNLIDAANDSPTVKRIVRLTGVCDTPFSFFSILINLLGRLAKGYNYEGEMLLRSESQKSNVSWDYTIIRPGVMSSDHENEGEGILALADNGEKLPVSRMSYGQIAMLCSQVCDYANCGRSTITAANVEPGKGAKEYGELLEKVKADTKKFPGDLLKDHVKGARIGAAIGVIVSGGLVKIFIYALTLMSGLLSNAFR